MTASLHWDGQQKIEGRKEDLRPLGERLLRKKEHNRMESRLKCNQIRQRLKTDSGVGLTTSRSYALTGAMRRDDDDCNKVSTFVFFVNWRGFCFGLI